MTKQTPQTEIVTDLLRRFPDAATNTLAKKAFKENPSVFKDCEAARGSVRYLRGNKGDLMRSVLKSKTFCRPNGKAGFTMPAAKTHFKDWGPVVLGVPARVLVLPDMHIPYHDAEAVTTALQYGREHGADLILLNGDAADFFSCSFWEKDPRERDFAGELATVKEFLTVLRGQFPKARIVYKLGNHEERFERYMRVKAPELLGVEAFTIRALFGLDALDITLVSDKRPISLGKLNIIHGHEYNFPIANPVNPARGFFLRAKTHCIGSHLHQSSQHSEKDLNGHIVSTWSTGCLCDLHPDYRPLNNWNHGFAFVEVDKSGIFNVSNHRIIEGKVY